VAAPTAARLSQPQVGANSGVTSPITSRYSSAGGGIFGPGGAYGNTQPYTDDEETTVRERARKDVQAQIDAINEMAAVELAKVQRENIQREGRTRALAANSGELSSPTGNTKQEQTTAYNLEQEKAILANKAEKIAAVQAGVLTRGDAIIAARKTEAQTGSEKYLAFLKDNAIQARADMKELATAGAELTHEQRQNLIDQTGYDPDTFDQLYQSITVANSNDYINKDKPEIVGNKAVFFKKNTDGTITTETVDLPISEGVDPKDIDVVSRKDGIYMLNKRDGTFKKIGQPEVSQESIDKATEKTEAKKLAEGEIAQNYGLVNELLNMGDSTLSAIAGVPGVSAFVPGTKTQLAQNKAKQLKAILSLENRQKLKGQGAVSDFEGKMIADAGSSLGINDAGRSSLGNADFKKEVRKVRGAFGLAAGQPQKVRITSPDGKTKDGSVTSEEANSAYLQGYLIEFID
jgi:hypothetical protein